MANTPAHLGKLKITTVSKTDNFIGGGGEPCIQPKTLGSELAAVQVILVAAVVLSSAIALRDRCQPLASTQALKKNIKRIRRSFMKNQGN